MAELEETAHQVIESGIVGVNIEDSLEEGSDLRPVGEQCKRDGLVLRGQTLYVVQNFLNRIAVIELQPDLSSGAVNEYLTSPYFRIPTTAAAFGDALYAVNARFDEIQPGQPALDDTLEAVRVEIH